MIGYCPGFGLNVAFQLASDFLPNHRNHPSNNEHEASATSTATPAKVSPHIPGTFHAFTPRGCALGFTGVTLDLCTLVKYTPKVRYNGC